MHILIVGGVGFIGCNIAREALARGHRVTAFDNLIRPGVSQNLIRFRGVRYYKFVKADIRKKTDFKKIPRTIDVIINLGANPSVPKSIADPLYDFEINVVGHLNVLEYARTHGKIPVILASSNKVYTDEMNTFPLKKTARRYEYVNRRLAQHGFDEDTDVDGFRGFTNSPYGVGKLAAEKYSREWSHHYGVPAVVNRMSCVYGEFQKGVEEQGWVDWFLRAKRLGKPLTIYGDGKQVRDVLFGADVARLYLTEAEAIEKFSGRAFNVGGGPQEGFHTSLLELITLIDSQFPGKRLRYRFAPWRDSDQKVYVSDIRRVVAATGWKPTTTLLKGLKIMWEAYERYGL
ncbi:NAD-dependent epimerase/dehydratase family protein [Candidatus Gottesmanbacteria bacterium]|nr:NAD-dependent epimerase/dehydratase family protein [Candidatus Gottesmanbacteria bacterium]